MDFVSTPYTRAVLALLDRIARGSDVETLARLGLLSVDALRARAEEALAYFVGDPRWVKLHIEQAAATIKAARGTA